MALTVDNILLIGSILLFVALLAGRVSIRLGIPILVFFLVVGMLAGEEGVGGIKFDRPDIVQLIGIIALCFILFSGGFETDWSYVKPVIWQSLLLSTLGVLLTAVTLGVFIWKVTDFSLYEALLLGSIISSTDTAAVFSILRSRNVALKGHIRPILEFESGSNDPMAIMLIIIFLVLVQEPTKSFWSIIPVFFQQLLIGSFFGIFFGFTGKFILNKINLHYEGLYPPLAITLMLLTYSVTSSLKGNGFLAVYLSALWLGNQDILHKRTIMKMFDGMAWFMQIILFLTLGLLVKPSNLLPVALTGLLISFFLMFFSRPLAVFLCLLPFKMKNRVRWFISWVGLKGAVPIVLATFPFSAGLEKADMIFNIVFFISLTSVLFQGTSIPAVAKWLHVSLPARVKPVTPADILLTEPVSNAMAEISVSKESSAAGKKIIDLGFPENSRIALIKRNGKYIIPDGQTSVMPEDKLILIAINKEILNEIIDKLCIEKVSDL